MKTRYDKLLELIEVFEPRSIVEIGTWNGQNAIRMLQAARKFHENPQYIGYDLFESATAETDAVEYNVKEHARLEAVERAIASSCSWAEVALVRGNTNGTLENVVADFVFIDGGHSIETIRHDYEAVKGSGVIVFDDYYLPDQNGKMPDISKFGCNLIVTDIPHYVIESNDAVRLESGGPQHGRVGLAVTFGGINEK